MDSANNWGSGQIDVLRRQHTMRICSYGNVFSWARTSQCDILVGLHVSAHNGRLLLYSRKPTSETNKKQGATISSGTSKSCSLSKNSSVLPISSDRVFVLVF